MAKGEAEGLPAVLPRSVRPPNGERPVRRRSKTAGGSRTSRRDLLDRQSYLTAIFRAFCPPSRIPLYGGIQERDVRRYFGGGGMAAWRGGSNSSGSSKQGRLKIAKACLPRHPSEPIPIVEFFLTFVAHPHRTTSCRSSSAPAISMSSRYATHA